MSEGRRGRVLWAVSAVMLVAGLLTMSAGSVTAAPPAVTAARGYQCAEAPVYAGWRGWGIELDDCNMHYLIDLFRGITEGVDGTHDIGWEDIGHIFRWNPIGKIVLTLAKAQGRAADWLEGWDRGCDHRGIVIYQRWGKDWKPVVQCR